VLESPDMAFPHRDPVKLYLASNSPRRKELLSITGLEFTLLPAQVDETPMAGENGVEYVQRIAHTKALAAAGKVNLDALIITADTAVVDNFQCENAEILGKPADRKAAVTMLHNLRGHVHQVFTGIQVMHTGTDKALSDLCATSVPMRNYSDAEIENYVASGDPLDKAGAYAIQHAGFHPVEGLSGCFANVMGLPLCHLTRTLAILGVTPPKDVPRACQVALGYNCPVYQLILSSPPTELTLDHLIG
jgi:septum formation protein